MSQLQTLQSFATTDSIRPACRFTKLCNREKKLLPRNGLLCFLAQLIASIFPSVPRTPNPPGTKTPLLKKMTVKVLCILNQYKPAYTT